MKTYSGQKHFSTQENDFVSLADPAVKHSFASHPLGRCSRGEKIPDSLFRTCVGGWRRLKWSRHVTKIANHRSTLIRKTSRPPMTARDVIATQNALRITWMSDAGMGSTETRDACYRPRPYVRSMPVADHGMRRRIFRYKSRLLPGSYFRRGLSVVDLHVRPVSDRNPRYGKVSKISKQTPFTQPHSTAIPSGPKCAVVATYLGR